MNTPGFVQLTTGRRFKFLVTTERADGSQCQLQALDIVARNTAEAWARVGEAIRAFMEGPDGRMVTNVWLEGL